MYLLQGLRDKIETIVSEEHLVYDEKGRRAEQAALGGGIGRLLERARKVRRVDVAERCGVDSGALEDREYVFARGERGGPAPERCEERGHGGIGGADASGRDGRAGPPRHVCLPHTRVGVDGDGLKVCPAPHENGKTARRGEEG